MIISQWYSWLLLSSHICYYVQTSNFAHFMDTWVKELPTVNQLLRNTNKCYLTWKIIVIFSAKWGRQMWMYLIEMTIETGDTIPKKQAAFRTPFAVRHKVAVQLQKMLQQNVIQLSHMYSLWVSWIVLVQKKGGCVRFCVDYWSLYAVAKPDCFPLLWIDNMLGQLENMKYSQHQT